MQHRPPSSAKTRLVLLQIAAAAALVAGCGGGGGDASTAAASGSRSFAAGAISGFGSVIVNGVRFDDTSAATSDDDGNSLTSASLKLGMEVEIQGGAVSDDGTGPKAAATAIRIGAEVKGPVASIDAIAKTLVMLGQTVDVLDTTVIDNRLAGGFAAIAVGTVLEVHGTRDPVTGAITATRIEPSAAAGGVKLKGPIAALDTTAKTFTIGGELVSFASVTNVPPNLANGLIVRVKAQAAPVAGALVATQLSIGAPQVADADRAEVEGAITAFTSSSAFSVNGIAVDASHAQFPEGTAGLALGAHVEVHGTSSNGIVTATSVDVETHADQRARGFELHGTIASVDTTAKTFVLRGITVDYSGAGVDFRKGTAAQLVVGAQLEVKGLLSADGTMLQATRISFGD